MKFTKAQLEEQIAALELELARIEQELRVCIDWIYRQEN